MNVYEEEADRLDVREGLRDGSADDRRPLARLILVRHGRSTWNSEHRCQGWTDVPLDAKGLEQAERVADHLASWHVDEIVTSDLERARKTADAIAARHDAPVSVDDRLRELHFGDCQGQRLADVEGTELGRIWTAWRHGEHFDALPGGEHPLAVYRRTAAAAAAAIRRSGATTGLRQVVLVSHGGPIRLLVCGLMQIRFGNWRQVGIQNASLTVLDIDRSGRAKLRVLNDTCHLHGVPVETAMEAEGEDAG